MLLIDLSKKDWVTGSIDRKYFNVPQPMVIYHNEDELDTNETNVRKIRSKGEFFDFIVERGLKAGEYPNFISEKIFIKSTDQYLPEYTDDLGITYFKINENHEFTKSEGCWVQLFYIGLHSYFSYIFTSSGIWLATSTKWDISGGPKTQYMVVKNNRKNLTDKSQRLLGRILRNGKGVNDEIRVIHTMLNPLSPYFLDLEGATRFIFKNKLTAEDKKKLISSEKFRNILMKELGIIIPGLTSAIREKLPPDKIADVLSTIVTKSVEKEDSEKAMARVKDIIDMAYIDPVSRAKAVSVPLIRDAEFTDKLSNNKPKEITKHSEGEDYPDGYVMEELPEGMEDMIPNGE